jgi:hypothetical protein
MIPCIITLTLSAMTGTTMNGKETANLTAGKIHTAAAMDSRDQATSKVKLEQ